jgi:hypothetical protein
MTRPTRQHGTGWLEPDGWRAVPTWGAARVMGHALVFSFVRQSTDRAK